MTLDDLLAICAAATTGPWEHWLDDYPKELTVFDWEKTLLESNGGTADDIRFVVAARTAMPELVRRLKRLREWYDIRKATLLSNVLTMEESIEFTDLIYSDL